MLNFWILLFEFLKSYTILALYVPWGFWKVNDRVDSDWQLKEWLAERSWEFFEINKENRATALLTNMKLHVDEDSKFSYARKR